MNTGVQRSSATPKRSWTTTTPFQNLKAEAKKNIDEIMAAHRIPYLATASLAFPEDLIQKVKKAKRIKGTRFIHILVPCPTGWRYQPGLTIRIARLAVETRFFPLYEVEAGVRYQLSKMPPKIPINEYISLQGRFRYLRQKELRTLQQEIDIQWEKLLDRCRR